MAASFGDRECMADIAICSVCGTADPRGPPGRIIPSHNGSFHATPKYGLLCRPHYLDRLPSRQRKKRKANSLASKENRKRCKKLKQLIVIKPGKKKAISKKQPLQPLAVEPEKDDDVDILSDMESPKSQSQDLVNDEKAHEVKLSPTAIGDEKNQSPTREKPSPTLQSPTDVEVKPVIPLVETPKVPDPDPERTDKPKVHSDPDLKRPDTPKPQTELRILGPNPDSKMEDCPADPDPALKVEEEKNTGIAGEQSGRFFSSLISFPIEEMITCSCGSEFWTDGSPGVLPCPGCKRIFFCGRCRLQSHSGSLCQTQNLSRILPNQILLDRHVAEQLHQALNVYALV